MSSPIVDRILAECNCRKAAREAILGGKTTDPSPSPEPARPEAEEVFSRVTSEVVPVVAEAVSSEISTALDRVRQDLVACLERELSRHGRPSPAEAVTEPPPAEEFQIESVDTDLDLPVEEVNRQLDQVFGEVDPLPKKRSAADKTQVIRLPDAPGPAPAPASPALRRARQEAKLFDPFEEVLPEVASLPEDSTPPAPPAAAAPAFRTPAEEVDVLPGLAQGISRILDEMERFQERFAAQLASVTERVAALEAARRAREAPAEPAAKRPRKGPGQEPGTGGIEELIACLGAMEERILNRIEHALHRLVEERCP